MDKFVEPTAWNNVKPEYSNSAARMSFLNKDKLLDRSDEIKKQIKVQANSLDSNSSSELSFVEFNLNS